MEKNFEARLDAYLEEFNDVELLLRDVHLKKVSPDSYPGPSTPAWRAEDTFGFRKHNRYTFVNYHTHDFLEMFFVWRGSCKNDISGEEITMYTGDVCLMAPGAFHNVFLFDDTTLAFNILVRKKHIESTFPRLLAKKSDLSFFLQAVMAGQTDYAYLYLNTQTEEMRRCLSRLAVTIMDRGPLWEMMAEILTEEYFALAEEAQAETLLRHQKLDLSQRIAREAYRYINNNYATASLGAFSAVSHYSPEYISRSLHKHTGHTFSRLLLNARMQNAMHLLRETDMSMEEIARAVGYDSREHFHRVFRERMGMTPKEFRKAPRSGDM